MGNFSPLYKGNEVPTVIGKGGRKSMQIYSNNISGVAGNAYQCISTKEQFFPNTSKLCMLQWLQKNMNRRMLKSSGISSDDVGFGCQNSEVRMRTRSSYFGCEIREAIINMYICAVASLI